MMGARRSSRRGHPLHCTGSRSQAAPHCPFLAHHARRLGALLPAAARGRVQRAGSGAAHVVSEGVTPAVALHQAPRILWTALLWERGRSKGRAEAGPVEGAEPVEGGSPGPVPPLRTALLTNLGLGCRRGSGLRLGVQALGMRCLECRRGWDQRVRRGDEGWGRGLGWGQGTEGQRLPPQAAPGSSSTSPFRLAPTQAVRCSAPAAPIGRGCQSMGAVLGEGPAQGALQLPQCRGAGGRRCCCFQGPRGAGPASDPAPRRELECRIKTANGPSSAHPGLEGPIALGPTWRYEKRPSPPPKGGSLSPFHRWGNRGTEQPTRPRPGGATN